MKVYLGNIVGEMLDTLIRLKIMKDRSYFTMRNVHYCIENYRRKAVEERVDKGI